MHTVCILCVASLAQRSSFGIHHAVVCAVSLSLFILVWMAMICLSKLRNLMMRLQWAFLYHVELFLFLLIKYLGLQCLHYRIGGCLTP